MRRRCATTSSRGSVERASPASSGVTFSASPMPGSESEAVALVNAYAARADTASRIAQIEPERS